MDISIRTEGRGLHDITDRIRNQLQQVDPMARLLSIFIPHTSASLLIQEGFDPSARNDLESFMNRLAPDGESWHTHTLEGPDDSSSHMKAALTATSLNIPIRDAKLALGQWQSIYLWEHRDAPHTRKVLLTVV